MAQDAPSFEAGTLAQALDEFNSGHYAQAVGVFERLARQGCVSALYYLAICARDNLGGTSIKYSEADVMLFMGEAAAKGAVVAQFFLGCALYSGSYITQGGGSPRRGESRARGFPILESLPRMTRRTKRKASHPRKRGLGKTASRNTQSRAAHGLRQNHAQRAGTGKHAAR